MSTEQLLRETIEVLRDENDGLSRRLLAAELALKNLSNATPVCWIRYCSDGCHEGPVMHSRMERVRIESGAWTPLINRPAQPPKNEG